MDNLKRRKPWIVSTLAQYTIEELRVRYESVCLRERAFSTKNEFRYMYRDQTQEYWESILNDEGGVMRKTPKDKYCELNGDLRSPVNDTDVEKRPKGIFFRTNIRNGKTPEDLPNPIHGDWRYKCTMDEMLARYPNIYFACDFKLGAPHVTLLMTNPDSTSDNIEGWTRIDAWCQEKLLRIDYTDPNGVIYRNPATGKWYVSSYFWVELLVTEDIVIGRSEVKFAGRQIRNDGDQQTPQLSIETKDSDDGEVGMFENGSGQLDTSVDSVTNTLQARTRKMRSWTERILVCLNMRFLATTLEAT